jgi:hypothetical protein
VKLASDCRYSGLAAMPAPVAAVTEACMEGGSRTIVGRIIAPFVTGPEVCNLQATKLVDARIRCNDLHWRVPLFQVQALLARYIRMVRRYSHMDHQHVSSELFGEDPVKPQRVTIVAMAGISQLCEWSL